MSVKELTNQVQLSFDLISEKYAMKLLFSSIGLIYIWFGALKFFAGYSPAEQLAGETLDTITFHLLDKQILLWGLAGWELLIGVFFFLRIKSKMILGLMLLHMAGTLLPIILFPEQVFNRPPFGFSIVGQYIMKNLVFIFAALIVYSQPATRPTYPSKL